MAASPQPPRRPLVVVEAGRSPLGRQLAGALAAARREGWELVRGWTPPAELERVVCTGTVQTSEDARRAVSAARAGAGVIVETRLDRAVAERLIAELRALGVVEHLREHAGDPRPLGERERALLALLAEGFSVVEAAAVLGVARQTAARRLAAARAHLGVESNAAAIAAIVFAGPKA